jgi:hypothetical protein
MCDKLDIPFTRQEKQIYPYNPNYFSNYSLGKLDISYNDPTTFQIQKFKNTAISELRTNGKIIVDISGDICDTGDQLKINGALKIENIISGPYRTEGGIIQFQRLFLHFDQLVIPFQLTYSYDIQKVCDASLNIIKDISGFDVRLDDTSGNKILFNNFFVTNALFETNRNDIFTGMIDQFRQVNGTFRNVYVDFISTLKNSEIFMLTIRELDRILCLSKNKNKKDIQSYMSPISRYNEKIARLKDKGYLDLIFQIKKY